MGKLSLPKKDKLKSRSSGASGDSGSGSKESDKELDENLMVKLQV